MNTLLSPSINAYFSNELTYILPFFTAGFITFFSLLCLRRIAHKIDLLDLPNERKQHQGDIPLIGGISILLGFIFTCLVIPLPLSPYKPLLGCMTLIVFLGFADDLRELTPRFRLLGQMLIVLLAMFWGNLELRNLGDLFFTGQNIHLHGVGAAIFTILAWLSFTNASNMQDGVDGLAGTVSAVQIASLLLLAFLGHAVSDAALLSAFLAGLIVFLCFNFPCPKNKRTSKIFMGDAGSLLLGFFTAWFAIRFSQYNFHHEGSHFPAPVTFLWITAVPLFDFFAVTISRILQRRSPMKGDRQHLHHYLEKKGYTPFQIVVIISLLSVIFSAVGLTLAWTNISEGTSFVLLLILLMSYIGFFCRKFK